MSDTLMVYLASPYTAIGMRGYCKRKLEADRLVKVTRIASKLTEIHGFAFILPITQSAAMTHFNKNMSGAFEYWSEIDYTFIRKSDELWVVMLPGWQESEGVFQEINYATKLKKPIKYIDPKLFESSED